MTWWMIGIGIGVILYMLIGVIMSVVFVVDDFDDIDEYDTFMIFVVMVFWPFIVLICILIPIVLLISGIIRGLGYVFRLIFGMKWSSRDKESEE